jgi:hypothetical protein
VQDALHVAPLQKQPTSCYDVWKPLRKIAAANQVGPAASLSWVHAAGISIFSRDGKQSASPGSGNLHTTVSNSRAQAKLAFLQWQSKDTSVWSCGAFESLRMKRSLGCCTMFRDRTPLVESSQNALLHPSVNKCALAHFLPSIQRSVPPIASS